MADINDAISELVRARIAQRGPEAEAKIAVIGEVVSESIDYTFTLADKQISKWEQQKQEMTDRQVSPGDPEWQAAKKMHELRMRIWHTRIQKMDR